jgi:hypothetical protein
MNLDLKKFTDHMSMHFGDEYWNKLNQYIKDSNAIIAGGAVLAAYSNDIVNDLDIYIHVSDAINFVNNLTNDGTYEISVRGNYLRPSYDQSFFRKNNILARFSFEHNVFREIVRRQTEVIRFPVIDVMIIPDEIPLLNVVTNFDLSFCEIWYDGYYVKAVDAKGVLTKTGTLKKDYTDKLLLDLNTFTVKRLKKYIKKGYVISYDSEKPINTFEKQKKSILSPEEWVVHKLYNWIVFSIRVNNKLDSVRILCTYPLPKYTLTEFRRILPDLVRKTLSPSFLIGIKNVKDIYIKILFLAGVKKYPPDFFRHVENTLNITMEDIDEYETRHVEVSFLDTYNHNEYRRGNGPTQSDIDAFEFDEADDIDESTIDIAVDIQSHLNEMNTLLFVNKDTDLDYDIISYSKDDIEDIVFNKNNWFYECTGSRSRWEDESNGLYDKQIDVYGETPYVRIPIGSDSGYIPLIQLKKLLQSYDKIYYVYKDYFMSHTIDYLRSWGGYPDRRSTNHCQNGSSIQSLTLKVCNNTEKCLKSLSNKTRESRILFSEE